MSLHNRLKEIQEIDGIIYKIHNSTRFAASECGMIIGRSARVLKPKTNGHYDIVSYQSHDKKTRHMYVHRLVAQVWHDNPNNLPEVNHIDGNKKNNNAKNLEWVDRRGNALHAISIGLNTNFPKKGQNGFQRKKK